MNGFTPIRTVRIISGLVAVLGMSALLMERALSAVLEMATEAVQMGLARYSNFTGRMAAENFAEDKQLLALLKDAEGLLPLGDSALTALLVLAILLMAVAVIGFAFPRQMGHALVAVKVLQWNTLADGESVESGLSVSRKTFSVAVALFAILIILCFGIRGCIRSAEESEIEEAITELQSSALAYIDAQKEFFYKNKKVGNASSLKMEDSTSTDFFTYKITSSRFTATSLKAIGKCPAGIKWTVSSSTKGIFNVDLVLYRSAPKNGDCALLTPDFKNLGRKKKAE